MADEQQEHVTMSPNHTTRRGATWAILGFAITAALALIASPAGAQTSSAAQQFATGAVTSVHGTSVQVDNQRQNSESTVTLAPTTQIQKRETAAAAAIVTGACVRVSGTGSTAKGISATTVALSVASSTGCTRGAGGVGAAGAGRFGGGQRPGNFGGGNGPPGGFRNGTGAGNRPANFAAASGPVVSVSGDKVVVKSTEFVRPTAKSTKSKSKAKSTAKPKTTTTDVTVTIGSSTAITQTVAGTAADVTVGSCVTAVGSGASGAVTAANLTVSAPVNGACGFGGGGFGGGAAGGGTV